MKPNNIDLGVTFTASLAQSLWRPFPLLQAQFNNIPTLLSFLIIVATCENVTVPHSNLIDVSGSYGELAVVVCDAGYHTAIGTTNYTTHCSDTAGGGDAYQSGHGGWWKDLYNCTGQ